jgi:hypothetical protein
MGYVTAALGDINAVVTPPLYFWPAGFFLLILGLQTLQLNIALKIPTL